jgi:O-antigen/teichoic acid export membrane protein
LTLHTDPLWLRVLPAFVRQRLEGRQNLFAVLRNSGWLVFDKCMRGLLTLLVGAWVARYLGPQQFGELSFVLAYLALFQSLAYLGLDSVVVRNIVRIQHSDFSEEVKKSQTGELLGAVFSIRLLSGMAFWLLAVVGMWSFTTPRNALLTALAGASLVFQAADTVDLWFQSQSQSKRTVLAKLVAYISSNGVRVALVLGDFDLVWFAAAVGLEFLLAAFALHFSYKRFSCGAQWIKSIGKLGVVLIGESYLFALAGLFNLISNKIDQLLLNQYWGDSALGLYSVFLPIIAICYSIPNMICISAMPHFARLHKADVINFRKKVAQFFALNYLLSFSMFLFIYIFSKEIILVFFGEQYLAAEDAMVIYALTAITTTSWIAQWVWTYNQEKGRQQLGQTFLGALLTTLFSILFIPIYGVIGASVAIVLSQFFAFILFNYFFDRELFRLQFCVVKG